LEIMEPESHRHPADRRTDDRADVSGLPLTWGLSRRRFGRADAPTGRVLNMSRGGFLALVPRTRDLAPGLEVPIGLCGGTGRVRITDVRGSARRGWRLCGLVLIDGDVQLLDSIERIIEDVTGQYARAWAAMG
jgi:hypothetical protein